jgi:predicted dehydrogenase
MKPLPPSNRRTFLKTTGGVAAASALAGMAVPKVHAAEDSTVQVALIGCGGRGGGAAANALRTKSGPIKLVSLVDVFENKVKSMHDNLKKEFQGLVDVPADRQFVGFDGYKHAIDCLKPGDVAIMTTPPAFRWVFYKYAIEKGVNVFMEKPVTVDAPSCHKMFALNEEAKKKNLKVGVGLMCRHSIARKELGQRIKNGEMGDLIALRAYRMHGPVAFFQSGPKPDNISELMYQVQRFHSFLWASGGCFSDFYIHNIDECCWMKDDWPVMAQASGGRHFRGDSIDQNFDNYSVEYTFKDGCKLYFYGRCIPGCKDEFASYAHGSKGAALISANGHFPAHCTIHKGQNLDKNSVQWAFQGNEPDPYQLEWDALIKAIREDTPHNEVDRGVKASAVTSMGRMAAHTGQQVTMEDFLDCKHEFAPNVDKLTRDSEAPLKAGPNGKYPVPQPGLNKDREYSV